MGTRLDPHLWLWKKNREKFWDIKKILDSVAETSEKTQCFSYSENSDELEKTLTKIKKILDEGSIKKWNIPSDNEKLEAIKKVFDELEISFEAIHNMDDMDHTQVANDIQKIKKILES